MTDEVELHGFLNVDKPLGWTSHDVVARIRKITGIRRVGHAGTLDPAATGVLVVGVGRATRFLDYIQATSKGYVAHCVLGASSDSADIDGRLDDSEVRTALRPDLSTIKHAINEFSGAIDQVPPRHSAIKVDGEPLYRKVRRGEPVDAPVRNVHIEGIEIVHYDYPDLVLRITCGPGVYIRSIARDVGESLGCGAYLHHLLRDRVGEFHIRQAHSLEQLATVRLPESWTAIANAIDFGLSASPACVLDEEATGAWYHGRSIPTLSRQLETSTIVRAVRFDGQFAGIGSVTSNDANETALQPRVVLPA